MSISAQIPEEIHKEAAAVAAKENVTVDELIASAVADWLRIWTKLHRKAEPGDREKFLEVLKKTPNVEPPEYDRL